MPNFPPTTDAWTGSQSVVSNPNSTVKSDGSALDVLLDPDHVWTGEWVVVLGYASIGVTSRSDQSGAVGFDFSMDGDTVDASSRPFITMVGGLSFACTGLRTKYVRVRYQNTGDAPQAVFRLQTILSLTALESGATRVNTGLSPTAIAHSVKAAVAVAKPDGTFPYAPATPDGIPVVAVANFPIPPEGGGPGVSEMVTVTNFPNPQQVAGTVAVTNFPPPPPPSPNPQPVSGTVKVVTDPDAPLEATVTGHVTVDNFPLNQIVSGVVAVNNFPATQPVSGSVGVSNFPATQTVAGTVAVSNLPATQTVSGTVSASIANFPASTTVTGSVEVSNDAGNPLPVSGTVSVGNFPATQAVTGTFYPATQPVSGSVTVSNLPATQPVSGTVTVSNFPASQAVTGTFWQPTQPVSLAAAVAITDNNGSLTVDGTVSVGNFPSTQTVTGSVSIANLPATQPVSGTVAVSNLPATQTVVSLPDASGVYAPTTGTLNSSTTTANQAVVTYTVPANKTLLLTGADVDVLATGLVGGLIGVLGLANFGVVSLQIGGVTVWSRQFTGQVTDRSAVPLARPVPLPAGTVVRIVATPAAGTSLRWVGNLSGVLV